MNVVFMGTGEIGLKALAHLIAHKRHRLTGVFTQPDKPVGRERVLSAPAVKTLACAHGIPVFQPAKIGGARAIAQLASLAPDLAIVIAYGQILPPEVIGAPALACLNLHASLLPRHRGAAPIQGAIREGDAQSGWTVIYIDRGLDSGDILLSESFPLDPGETGQSLHDRLAALAPAVVERTLRAFERGDPPRTPQDHSLATKSPKLSRADGRIDWTLPAAALERMVRAYDPWPGTTTRWDQAKPLELKIFPPCGVARDGACAGLAPGSVAATAAGSIDVATGAGVLRITQLQPEGRRRMTAAEFLRGAALAPGDRLM